MKTPFYPLYSKIRPLLRVFDGMVAADVLDLKSGLFAMRGTPQDPADWQDPDTWIPERTSGRLRELASQVWEGTGRLVNPRYLMGSWLLIRNHELLIPDGSGVLQITDHGRDFLKKAEGSTVRRLDEEEGLGDLLRSIAARSPVRRSDLLPVFSEYAIRASSIKAASTINSFMRYRISNLIDRDYVERSGFSYVVTESGLDWIKGFDANVIGQSRVEDADEIFSIIRHHQGSTRNELQEKLAVMDPYQFEHLVKELLVAMGYEDVEVTSKSNDGGVDVIGRIQVGISEIKEVIQVKRIQGNVGRPALDKLRGSLHRFGAVRGSIITNGDFAKGTRDAAFEAGGAPITLINGEKLIDLMIEHRVGVKKRVFEILEIDLDSFDAAADAGGDSA